MISKQDIQKLSELARIEVSDSEAEKLGADLERILAYVQRLEQAETGDTKPAYNGIELENQFRRDEPFLGAPDFYMYHDALLEAAPMVENGYIKVKAIWKKQN